MTLEAAGTELARARELATQARATYLQEPEGEADDIKELDAVSPP